MKEELVEVRNPLPEDRRKPETRNSSKSPEGRAESVFGFRPSDFLRVSDLGFRICHAALVATALLAWASPTPAFAQTAIPYRPEKLTYPPLVYEPPVPEKFRVQLKNGPVAYVVPDR